MNNNDYSISNKLMRKVEGSVFAIEILLDLIDSVGSTANGKITILATDKSSGLNTGFSQVPKLEVHQRDFK